MFVGMQQQNNGRTPQATHNGARTEAITTTSATPNQTEQNQNIARQVNGRGRGCRGAALARGRGRGGRGAWNGQQNPPPQQPATRTTPSCTQPATYSTAECTNCGWTHRDGNCAAMFSVCYECKSAGHFADVAQSIMPHPRPNNKGMGPRTPLVIYGKSRETRGDCKHTLR